MSGQPKRPNEAQTLIDEKYLDVPTQRLYSVSLGLLCQAIKLIDIFRYWLLPGDATTGYFAKWAVVDVAYCLILSQLRIPRLRYPASWMCLQIVFLCLLDAVCFGSITFNTGLWPFASQRQSSGLNQGQLASTPEPWGLSEWLAPLGIVSYTSSRDAHLLGQHTVRMSPISTAQINPDLDTFCLAPSVNEVIIPILLNNTDIAGVRYTLTPLGYVDGQPGIGRVETVTLSSRDLKAMEQTRLANMQLVRQSVSTSSPMNQDDFDEFDDEPPATESAEAVLQNTQSVTRIRVTKPGTITLERVVGTDGTDARILGHGQVVVVPCPRAQFAVDKKVPQPEIRCASRNVDAELNIEIGGVPPLKLRWIKEVNGRREPVVVEGIEGNRKHDHGRGDKIDLGKGIYEEVKVPLTVILDAVGTHAYLLDEVTDGVGNIVRVGSSDFSLRSSPSNVTLNTPTARSITVLRRPTMSFRHCGLENPASLLIGSEAQVSISAGDVDPLDSPLEVQVKYQPPTEDDSTVGNKRFKPWKKAMKSSPGKSELVLRANAPGEYTLEDVHGKYCSGDVLAPETCRIIEKPHPTAEIEWTKIHECSGDTGVSASLVMHGTPPFVVYYRTQRDKEPVRDLSRTFNAARGELTLQPERAGHYVYSFAHISDANYAKIPLDGPAIDQVVHPLASANFRNVGQEGRKRMINSCAGSSVNVDVEFRGTGPWNLELQVVGGQSSETIHIKDINSSPRTIEVPIPKAIDKSGGAFDIALVSVEDAHRCKRTLSVPGISIRVRRVKPTAKFYSGDGVRHATVLEREQANLPLRLTGDGPWRLKYRRQESPDQIMTFQPKTPNDQLPVTNRGTYEILEVTDSQCPGSVFADESTYTVDWLSRPYARLSSETDYAYESYNGSHVLPAVCEGVDDHVDLDLTGRPPFQIMYNIAADNEIGGTKVLDQPTFTSIQPRTRFQLHTSAAGRKYYEVKQVGDAAYPLAKHKDAVIPREQRLLFEQDVLSRPGARFKNRNRLSHCLYDALSPRDSLSSDGTIELEGTPPFRLHLSIRDLAASTERKYTVKVEERTWRLNLPSHSFMSIGPQLVTITSVQDASHCAQAPLDPTYRSIWVDVAETAAIVPFDRREHYCVGDVSQFQLEGTPPWTIGYRINGKSHTQEAKVSPFSLVQQQPGEFSITSIAHQQKMCKAAVADLRFAVHALPAAQVGHGKRIYQDIHEGDQAEIVFTLIGEPPFTFTYQRSEPAPKKGGKPGKVLETHTVSGVTSNEYSIYSALEGTWTVTSISDKFCRYPPAQPDALIEKGRR